MLFVCVGVWVNLDGSFLSGLKGKRILQVQSFSFAVSCKHISFCKVEVKLLSEVAFLAFALTYFGCRVTLI